MGGNIFIFHACSESYALFFIAGSIENDEVPNAMGEVSTQNKENIPVCLLK